MVGAIVVGEEWLEPSTPFFRGDRHPQGIEMLFSDLDPGTQTAYINMSCNQQLTAILQLIGSADPKSLPKILARCEKDLATIDAKAKKEASAAAKLAEKEAKAKAKLAEKEANAAAKLAEKEARAAAKLAEKEAKPSVPSPYNCFVKLVKAQGVPEGANLMKHAASLWKSAEQNPASSTFSQQALDEMRSTYGQPTEKPKKAEKLAKAKAKEAEKLAKAEKKAPAKPKKASAEKKAPAKPKKAPAKPKQAQVEQPTSCTKLAAVPCAYMPTPVRPAC